MKDEGCRISDIGIVTSWSRFKIQLIEISTFEWVPVRRPAPSGLHCAARHAPWWAITLFSMRPLWFTIWNLHVIHEQIYFLNEVTTLITKARRRLTGRLGKESFGISKYKRTLMAIMPRNPFFFRHAKASSDMPKHRDVLPTYFPSADAIRITSCWCLFPPTLIFGNKCIPVG